MPGTLVNEFFGSLMTGLFIGACLVAILVLAQFARFWYFLRNKYHKAVFDVFLSSGTEEANYTVSCEVRRHSILFTAKSPAGVVLFNGEFVMNPLNLKFGEGYYHRVRNENDPPNHEAYGFMKVLIKNDWTFLVEDQSPALSVSEEKTTSLAHPAIVWKRA